MQSELPQPSSRLSAALARCDPPCSFSVLPSLASSSFFHLMSEVDQENTVHFYAYLFVLCFLITKCVSFLFFSPLSYVLLKISIHPARYISYPAFGLHAYVCLKQPLCLLHPLLNTHTHLTSNHTPIHAIPDSRSSGQLSERYL